jgi:hypothetical protein
MPRCLKEASGGDMHMYNSAIHKTKRAQKFADARHFNVTPDTNWQRPWKKPTHEPENEKKLTR